jgi:hypothetical protein
MAAVPKKANEAPKASPPAKTGNDRFSRARASIEEAIKKAEEEHRRRMLRHRIDVARAGVKLYKEKKIGEAVKMFHTYIRILEDWKGVNEGGLTPKLFDKEKDVAELLLISGVFWDLAKLYDRTRSERKKKDFFMYMEKYILFSKDMPFQPVSAETLRKYIENDKPIHKDHFKSAYKVIGGGKCFIATSLFDVSDPRTIVRLQSFRDERLVRVAWGRAFIRLYYAVGPLLAQGVSRLPLPIRSVLGRVLDRIANWLT